MSRRVEKTKKVDAQGRIVVSRTEVKSVGGRRQRALGRVAGALPDVWPEGALDELRDEWR